MKDETLYCRMTPAMKRQLDQEATRRGESASSVVREALREYFERRTPEPLRETPPPYGHAPTKPEPPPHPTTPDTKKSRGLPGFAAALSLAAMLLLAGCATGPSLYERQLSEIETAYTAGQITAAQRLELRLQAQQAAAARAQADSAYWQNAGANANNAALQNFNTIRANQYNPYLKK